MRTSTAIFVAALAAGSTMLAGCNPGNSTVSPAGTKPPSATPTPTPVGSPTPSPTPSPVSSGSPGPTPTPTAQPQVVHIGFGLVQTVSQQFGKIAYYSPTQSPPQAAVVTVKAGSQIVFSNDTPAAGSQGIQHTASGLGTSGFPSGFGSNNPFNPAGSAISGTFWSTGTINPGTMSTPFTVGPPGTYYFGCGYHYAGSSNNSMRDVIVSQ